MIRRGLALGLLALSCGGPDETAQRISRMDAAAPEAPSLGPRRPSFLGVIVAQRAVDLAPRVEARLAEVRVRLGNSVGRGDCVARLDVAPTRRELAVAQAALRGAQAEVERAGIELAAAQARVAKLEPVERYVAGKDLEEARYEEKLARARVTSAEAQVAERQAQMDLLGAAVAEADVQAPFDGRVAAVYAEAGSIVGPGRPIFRLVDVDKPWVRFAMPQREARAVASSRVDVSMEEFIMAATVHKVAPEVDPASGMVIAEATLDETSVKVVPGTVVRVMPR